MAIVFKVKPWYKKNEGNVWVPKVWNGSTPFYGNNVWNYNDETFYSDGDQLNQKVLDKSTDTWSSKTWIGMTRLIGSHIWKDITGEIYHTYRNSSPVIDCFYKIVVSGSTYRCDEITFSGYYVPTYGNNIWTDGDSLYYSSNGTNYKRGSSVNTWSLKSWSGLSNFYGSYIWSDGDNIYYSSNSTQKVLDKSTSTWEDKNWNGFSTISGNNVWKHKNHIYFSFGENQYELDKSTGTWIPKTWIGLTNFSGARVWTDGDRVYYSAGSDTQYELT